ncbi:hypothetical protein FB451DRAFT_1164930 [Mycena latifolia]|nr:hypothetical protein FB451DRAFT_1164930 [Mycena latifolia]
MITRIEDASSAELEPSENSGVATIERSFSTWDRPKPIQAYLCTDIVTRNGMIAATTETKIEPQSGRSYSKICIRSTQYGKGAVHELPDFGYLRQELREIEILDGITRLRVENVLSMTVTGLYRRALLRSYQTWKGASHEVPGLHPALSWSSDMGSRIPDVFDYGQWSAAATTRKNPLEKPVKPVNMLKNNIGSVEPGVPTKKMRTNSAAPQSVPKGGTPVGLIWDNLNYSYAYDATFSILCNIWMDNIVVRTAQFTVMSPDLHALAQGFESRLRGNSNLEAVRDAVRHALHSRAPDVFPNGARDTSIDQ